MEDTIRKFNFKIYINLVVFFFFLFGIYTNLIEIVRLNKLEDILIVKRII